MASTALPPIYAKAIIGEDLSLPEEPVASHFLGRKEAFVEAVAGRAGRGAGSISFGTLDGCFADGVTYAGLYDKDLTPMQAYEAVKNTLIRMAKN